MPIGERRATRQTTSQCARCATCAAATGATTSSAFTSRPRICSTTARPSSLLSSCRFGVSHCRGSNLQCNEIICYLVSPCRDLSMPATMLYHWTKNIFYLFIQQHFSWNSGNGNRQASSSSGTSITLKKRR